MMAACDDLPIHHQDGAHRGIWARMANSLLRLRKRGAHEGFVLGCAIHRRANIASSPRGATDLTNSRETMSHQRGIPIGLEGHGVSPSGLA